MVDSLGEVFLLKTTNRAVGVPELINRIGLSDYSKKQIAIKANFNSADPFPASTHLDTLRAIIGSLKNAEVGAVTLAERSGMGNTENVLEQMGVFALSKELGFETLILDNIDKDGWVKFNRDKTHWLHGFYLAKVFHDADKIVQTCCLKTHRFGGHFTLIPEKLCGDGCKESSRRNLRLHVGAAWIPISASDDCGNKQQLQLGLCCDGRHKSIHQ